MIENKNLGIKEVFFRKTNFKLWFISSPFIFLWYKYNQNAQRTKYMNRIKARDHKIQLGFEEFQEKLQIDYNQPYREEKKKDYLILFYGQFQHFFPLYINLNKKITSISPQFIYYLDKQEDKPKLEMILKKQGLQNLHIITEEDIPLRENTVYCVSPDNTLIHSEQIRDINFSQIYTTLQIKINKYKEKQFLSTLDFKL